ncbi:oligosaccharide flippase family protein [Actinoplanes sp. M2I2]|uniref:oligosaccharide flippase family protein n=1 Tax=Actinoplanes sp. M2I2 TaxID=1734444 RepID=UPI0020214CDA|nr:oligosaccharide flippase family protein [Actinoplanes sp. M2I2]
MATAHKVKRALAWSTVNNVVLRVSNLAVGILLARLLSPEEFGVFAVAMTALAIVMALADLGMSADIVRHGVQGRAGTVTTISMVTSALLTAGMWLAAGPVSDAMGSPQAAPVVRVMSLTLLLSGLSVVPYAIMQREYRQSAQMGLDTTSFVLGTALTVGFVLLGMGAMALALSRVIAQAVVTVFQFILTRTRPVFGFDRGVTGQLLVFGVPLAAANVLSWVVMNAGHLTVGAVAGTVMLGLYTLAFNISTWPMSALGMAIRVVALPAFAGTRDDARRADGFVAAAALTWGVALLVGVGLSALAPVIVPLLYGERWSPAAAALAGLAVFGALRVLFDLIATFLIAVGASRPVLVVQAVWLVVLLPAVIVGQREFGLAGTGWAQVIVCAVLVLPLYAVFLRRHHVPLGTFALRLLAPALLAVPAVLAGRWAVTVVSGAFPRLLLGGAVTAAVYVVPLLPWLRRRLAELRGIASDPAVTTEIDQAALAVAAKG